jgi:hypothetical protein
MSKVELWHWIMLFTAIGVLGILALSGNDKKYFSDVIVCILTLVGTCLAFREASIARSSSLRTTTLWTFFGAGFLLWFLGEFTWLLQDFFLGEAAAVSIADVFWFIGYASILLGIWFLIVAFWGRKTFQDEALFTGVYVLFTAAVYAALFTVVQQASHEQLITSTTAVYLLLDSALVSGSMMITFLFYYEKFKKTWLLFSTGVLCFAVADLSFYFLVGAGTYYVGSLPDVLYAIGYGLMVSGIAYQRAAK